MGQCPCRQPSPAHNSLDRPQSFSRLQTWTSHRAQAGHRARQAAVLLSTASALALCLCCLHTALPMSPCCPTALLLSVNLCPSHAAQADLYSRPASASLTEHKQDLPFCYMLPKTTPRTVCSLALFWPPLHATSTSNISHMDFHTTQINSILLAGQVVLWLPNQETDHLDLF